MTGDKTQQYEAVVSRIVEQKSVKVEGKKQEYQKLDLLITSGKLKGKHITVENGTIAIATPVTYRAGDTVIVTSASINGQQTAYISDFMRTTPIYLLFVIFIVLALVVGKFRGLTSLIGMAISFFVIFSFILPNILSGHNPIEVVLVASLFIVPVTFYISHGFNKKTTAAMIGTILTIIISGVLAAVFVQMAHLTGTASEEVVYLTQIRGGANINLQGLLFAGILIAIIGILDDITISQASVVAELRASAPHIKLKELYLKAMNVGHDHIASMINTLILVYTGAALPLLLLFVNYSQPFTQVISYEVVAEEIVRTLVTSIGLILAVPLTTFIACMFYSKD